MVIFAMGNRIPVVSVLMTAYNREEYIGEAIESVLSSSYNNFELIIVDDRSTDKTLQIAQDYTKKDERICAYQNERNLGDYPNRNKAALYAKGKYLKYLDSDDMIYFYGLEAMVEAMERFPNAAMGISHPKPEEDIPYPFVVSPEDCFREQFLGPGMLNCGPSGAIIRREIFGKEGGFRVDRFLGDTELWYRLGMKYPVIKMAPGLVWWRTHEQQEIIAGVESLYYLISGFKLDIETLSSPDCPLSSEDRAKAICKVKQHHARRILSVAIRKKRIWHAFKVFKESRLGFMELARGLRSYQ